MDKFNIPWNGHILKRAIMTYDPFPQENLRLDNLPKAGSNLLINPFIKRKKKKKGHKKKKRY